ncbi:MAG TPA: phosphatidylserine/phosphatidylglycerophosphate/cardiolipin synthase family protein [Kofleriaceae bacterium]|nr:phosphatidylserine/phosphatidylglycerophosphate/cardiolipin synthase family protein [Kofleriaceae bacterium]
MSQLPVRADYTPATTTLLAAITRYARSLYRLRRGNDVAVLRGGEPFPAMLAAIAGARRAVLLETYIFVDDATGLKFVAALCERAQAGVAVRLIFDAIGGIGLDRAYVDRMRQAGVQVVEYHPIAPWRARFNLSHRDHRKILVVDDEIGFTGGINLSDDYAPTSVGGRGWYDVHCSLRGPVVADLARIFRRTWIAEGGAPYPAPEPAEKRPMLPANIAARIVDNTRRKRRGAIRRAYLAAISAARETVLIENAYFLPDRAIRRAMVRAVERGVEVAIIVPGRSDVRAIEFAGLYIYRWFVQRGVRILRWTGPMMHAKTAVIDAMWSTIGSYNLDARSLRYNLEVIIEIIDGDIGAGMVEQFRVDEQSTTTFDLATWKSFGWWRKALAWLAFRFRSWL